jgi:autotransporter-associated beta strand protein
MNMSRLTGLSVSLVSLFVFTLPSSAADRTWTGEGGDGLWATAANWDSAVPAAGDVAVFNAVGGAVSVGGDATVATVRVAGASDVTLNIADGKTLFVSNAGGTGLDARTADLTINGPGFLKFSTAGGGNDLDNGANAGHELILNAKITGGDFGFEAWRAAENIPGGTIVMDNPANDFTGWIQINGGQTVAAGALADIGLPSPFGAGDRIRFNYSGTLRYTGAGGGTDRALHLNGGAAPRIGGCIEQAGTGPVVFSGPVLNIANSAQTLVLLGDSASAARITGPVYNSTGTLAIRKEGSGTWVLAGSNTFSGGLTVDAGTLGLDSTNACGTVSQITLNGGTLAVNHAAADGFTATLPPIAVAGHAAVTVAQADSASTVTFSGITASESLAVTAPGAGTDANRIFVIGLPPGVVGPWLTLNGGAARYDLATGLAPVTASSAFLATKGNDLPNGDSIQAVINSVGTGADITLPADPTRLYSLTQTVAGDDATVAMAGGTLYAGEVAVASEAAALTVGAQPQDGALLPPVVDVPGLIIPDNSAIAALAPVIWYDPSEAASVRLSVGTVTGLVNKGTGGVALDAAVVRSNFTAPFYATGFDSHAALPMLRYNATSQGLQSLANCGIAGKAVRTLAAVMSRDAGKECIVSIGNGATGNAFEPYLRNDVTRFGTYSGDIDVPVKPAATPVVMVFLNGVGGNADIFQGFADGVASATRTRTDLNTVNTALNLGHRNGASADSFRGQIGEVLLFDRTLSDTERETVETYLAAKWQQPKPAESLVRNVAMFTLRNDSAAPLTVNAAVNEPLGNSIALIKPGAGTVALAGGATLTGPVRIDGGTLAVNTPAGVEDTLGGAISGAGALAKGGDGLLRLPYTVASTYAGGTAITGGILRIGNSAAFGTGDIVISGGGTLDFGDNVTAGTVALTNRITVSGAGFEGKGALVNNSGIAQINAITRTAVTLADDATFGGSTTARWDFRTQSLLDLAGHTLTKTGPADLRFSLGVISNAPAGTAIRIQEGTLGLEAVNTFEPNTADRAIEIASGARFGVYDTSVPFNWTVRPADGAVLWAYGLDTATNKNVFTSDIALDGTLHLTAGGAYGLNLAGLLSGTGGLSVHDGGALAMGLLSHPANTFLGPVAVSNIILGLRAPGSLPDVSKLALANFAGTGVRVYPLGGWTGADVKALAECGTFVPNTRLQFDVAAGETASLPCDLGAPFLGQLDKLGAGELALDGNITMGANARTYAGALTLTNAATFDVGNFGFYLGDGTGANTALTVGGDARLVATDRGAGVNQAGLWIAPHPCKAVAEIKDNAFVQGKIMIGGDALADATAVGAVYMSGNSRWASPGGNGNDSMIGKFGYGFFQLDGGELAINGGTQFGNARNSENSVGILRQTGGSLVFTQGYGGTLAFSRGGVGVAQMEGGTARIAGQLELLDDYNNNGEGGNNLIGGTAVFTVAGTADVTTGGEVLFGNRTSGTAILNLNGGKLTTTYLRRLNKATTATVNFNGGILSVTNSLASTPLISADNAAIQLDARVYAGGAVIDLGESVARSLDIPLARATGAGVVSVPVTAGGSGYIAPPYVSFTGGGGSGATAFARINRDTGALTAIEITCPGVGYTSAPTVKLTGGGGTGAACGAVALYRNTDGGLTKTGPGILALNAANTYWGPTVVAGGTLRLSRADAIAPASDLVIGDGLLDLGGFTVTNRSVTVTGTGGIVNGKIVTASAIKTGAGTGVWGAGIQFAALTNKVPGLYEGFVDGAANLTAVNPGTAVKLGTEAANTTSAAIWATNRTGIYSGYIWNNEDHDVTWTFAKNFDDTAYLFIDGTARAFDANTWSVLGIVTVTLTPGPHAFDVRFGQGTGGAGPNIAGWGSLGFGIDFQGRGEKVAANFVSATDPGDGSLFTTTLGISDPDDRIRVVEGALRLPTAEPGLLEGRVAGFQNWTAIPATTTVNLDTALANRYGTTQGDSFTLVYTGCIWNNSPDAVTWSFLLDYDDQARLVIDGTAVLPGGVSAQKLVATVMLTPGAHAFEVRFSENTGNEGPWAGTLPFAIGIDKQGRGVNDAANYVKLADPGDGSLLTVSVSSGADLLAGTTVDVSEGAALDMGGVPREGVTVVGEGAVVNGGVGEGAVLSPAGDTYAGPLSVSGGPLSGVTYRLTIHDPNDNVPGLWEGLILGAWNTTTPNPKTAVQLTTRAGNGTITNNTIYAGGLWAGNNRNWVYTGYLWNRAATNVTWTWRFTFDDNVALWLDGALVRYVALSQGVQYQNTVLTPGPHAIEVRYNDGTGNVGPAASVGLGGLSYDPFGRGASSAAGNFILLEDAGDGQLLSLTADSFDHICDVISSDGTLDLTGLTIVPSDERSAEPPGREYVIAHAEGGFTGTPTLSGFTGKKWKTLRKGNDLLLTTQGGTILLLK